MIKEFDCEIDLIAGHFYCTNNQLTSLKNIHKHIKCIKGEFHCADNNIDSHILGLLLIDGVIHIEMNNKYIQNILNRHLGKGRQSVMDAQRELIDAGYEEFAQL